MSGVVERQTERDVLQGQDNTALRRPGHVREVLGARVHARRRRHARRQRGGPQHVRGPGPRHRVGLPPRGAEQGEPGQRAPGLHHLGRAVPDRGQGHRSHRPRQVLLHVHGAGMILGL